ncbi:MAG: hypothetical protein JWM68_35, partial [Verrucomicrobiales bacterium]|nr:hypothetical protein [Verrucomicrobiales bacterium]
MKNPTPKNQIGVLALVLALYKGALEHGLTIGLNHITAAILLALRVAALTARDVYETAKLAMSDRRITYNEAYEAAREFVALARDILKPIFGKQYNQRWDITGFVGSLQVPDSVEELLVLVETIHGFLSANPTLEMGTITAAKAQLVFDALSNARSAIDSQKTVVSNLIADRDVKFEALRKGVRDLINELDTLIDPMDARWLSFGLNKPGAEETPDAVVGLIATLIGPTAAALKWPAAARGSFYHVYRRIVGVDAELVLVGSPADIDFTLENLP